ncbi:MAG: HisA/HisF-related TIM barrel protein [Armatimonadota bacterium]
MEVIPGIDLLDSKAVCPVPRGIQVRSDSSHDPAVVAKVWADQGARRLYIADLDGARMGEPQNLKEVEKIIKASKLPVDLGGGIRTIDTAKRVLDLGVDRIVVGTTAALEENLARLIFSEIPEKTILSVASLNGYVAVRDWQARTDEPALDFARRMCKLGAKRIVFTDVSRKGMHGGINFHAIKKIASSLQVPVIASGGVSSIEDIQDLKELEPMGVEGVVVVTALYSGMIKLSDAIKLADSTPPTI